MFNESPTLEQVVRKVQATNMVGDLILVNDGSDDRTRMLMNGFESSVVRVFHHAVNEGKGAALKTGFMHAKEPVVIVQDADLEYDPCDYPALIEPILNDEADVVFGSRFLGGSSSFMPRTTLWANRIITWFFNLATGQRLTDVETCYKSFRLEVLDQIAPTLRETGFGIEIELAAKVVKISGVRIVERPIRYRARSRREGKKIRWTDGLWALWCILRYR